MRIQRLVMWTSGLLSLIAASVPSATEVIKRASVDGLYDSNAFKSSGGTSDVITQTSFYLARRDTSARTGVEYFYAGDLDVFAQSGQRLFTTHHLGLAYIRQVGKARNLVSAGGNLGGRWDRAVYNYYDNLDGTVYASFKMNLDGVSSLRAGYRMNLRKYLHLDSSSYREHLLSLTYNTSFPSRTAMKADVSYGLKGYTMARMVAVAPFSSVASGPGGRRRGMQRIWWGFGPMQEDGQGTSANQAPLQSASPGKSQITLALRLSQSLSPSTGANIQYLHRINPLNSGLYQTGLATSYAEDDDLFDDHYDYRGQEVSGGFSQLLPWGSKLSVEAGYTIKNFRNKPALDLNGLSTGVERQDRKRYISSGIEMPLGMNLDLSLLYSYGTNLSNDSFYQYRGNHVVSVGINRGF